MTDHMKLTDILMDELPEEHPWKGNIKGLVEKLLANGVTVQECGREYWDVCNNNGNIQYRCPHCETVYIYMYKDHIAPDACRECGTKLYLPQPPKGE